MVQMKTSSDGRRLLYRMRNARRTILESLSQRRLSPKQLKTIKDVLRILKDCDRPSDEIDVVRSTLRVLEESGMVTPVEAMKLEDIVTRCESDLRSFISDTSGMDVEILDDFRPKEEMYLEELRGLSVEEGRPQERLTDFVRSLVYSRPGLFITEIHQRISSENLMDISYPSVRYHINALEDAHEIVTMGGPQGAARYCFPNPQRIPDKEMYYGLPFPVIGEIEEMVTDHWVQNPRKKWKDLFVVNGTADSRILLVVDFNCIQLEPGTPIASFGKLETIEYLASHERLRPSNGTGELQDGLLALKVDMRINGEEKEVWFDEEMLRKKSLYA